MTCFPHTRICGLYSWIWAGFKASYDAALEALDELGCSPTRRALYLGKATCMYVLYTSSVASYYIYILWGIDYWDKKVSRLGNRP